MIKIGTSVKVCIILKKIGIFYWKGIENKKNVLLRFSSNFNSNWQVDLYLEAIIQCIYIF